MKPDTEQRRIKLALTPTPVQRLAALSDMLGTQIYCKRDDLTGVGFGGNKIRKLEYLLYDALDQECDTLITCGSNQSNWCCMTAAAGATLGMEVHLVLGGPVPERDTGNIRLNRIAGAKMRHIDTNNDDELEAASAELAHGRLEWTGCAGLCDGIRGDRELLQDDRH
jgi:D-cysteine desulfhydrase